VNIPVYSRTGTRRADTRGTRSVHMQANLLGYAGLIPFVTLAALPLFFQGDVQSQTGTALIAYGAVIISFLGACHWSAAIIDSNNDNVASRMLFAVSPALLGWLAVLLPLPYGFMLIITGLLITLIADSHWSYGPAWYAALRRRLTWIATLSLSFATLITLDVI